MNRIVQLEQQLAATERKYLDMERRHRESERQLATAERTLEATHEVYKEQAHRKEADYTRELNAKLAQINAQSKAIRELFAILKTVAQWDEYAKQELAKHTAYPLPDGRTI